MWRGAAAALVAGALALALAAAGPAGRARSSVACRPAATAAVVEQFVTAFNAGRLRDVDRLFGSIGVFRWYSTTAPGARLGEAAKRRETLIPYLSARLRAGERLRLRVLRFSGADAERSLGHFAGSLHRSARGFPARTYLFKGSAECSSGQPLLIVWSMGGPL